MKRPIRVLVGVVICVAALFAVFTMLIWRPFTSKEEELTGLSFQLTEVAFFDNTGGRGEGHRIWIYRIPNDAAQRLNAKGYPLSKFPMWSALAFDGYERIQWMPTNTANSADVQLVMKSVFSDESATETDLDDVHTMADARRFAHALTKRRGTLIAGWYTAVDSDSVTNYFVYVMNLNARVLVKLSLLT